MPEMKAPLFSPDGSPKGDVRLDPEIFGIEPNMDVLHQVVNAQMAAARSGSASTKTRAEVRGGGRKPWRQKGLGRARHGSIRSPIWVGGGVAHGPKPRDYSQRTPKKMKRLALRSALSARASEEAIRVVDTIDWDFPRTKSAQTLLDSMGAAKKALVVLGRGDDIARKSFRNISRVFVSFPDQVTPYDVLWADDVVFTTDTVASVGASGGFEVTESDFVKEEVSEGAGGEG